MFYIVTEKRIIMGNQENKLYHFVGIKGSGMSSLALVLHQKGYNVQGSDVEEYFFTQRDLENQVSLFYHLMQIILIKT